jgi:very-short-patch-repair endonuclease
MCLKLGGELMSVFVRRKPFTQEEQNDISSRIDKLPDRIREEIHTSMLAEAQRLLEQIEKCESPIEQLLSLYLMPLLSKLEHYMLLYDVKDCINFIYGEQEEIEVNGHTYRVDFFVICGVNDRNFKLVVECDGHEFHEKTKEQVARDKQRDRELTMSGFHLLRYAGSEIWKDPEKCAKEIVKYVISLAGLGDEPFVTYFK